VPLEQSQLFSPVVSVSCAPILAQEARTHPRTGDPPE
jgi:hypothetical protein